MEALDAADPRQIGQYRLLRRLGAGGMGQVYLGRTAGGRTVAVKTVHREYAADHEFRTRFRQEVSAARRVGGRWTAPVLDADTEGERPWVATAYVAGPSLATAVREFGPLPGPAVRVLALGLAEALAAVHALGLVHRDVKPSNVLLALDGPRLIDFGITRSLDAATALTQSGFVIGSPGYLSPEQARGLPSGPAGDVFSLGAVLAYAATGNAPFGSDTGAPALLYRVVHEEPDLSRLLPQDPEFRELLTACLAKDPERRPTPERLREVLAPASGPGAGRAANRLGGDWLPPAVAGSLARLAVELLDLDSAAGPAAPGEALPGGAARPAAGHAPGPTPTAPGHFGPGTPGTPGTPGAPGAPVAAGVPGGRFGPPEPWVSPPPPATAPGPWPGQPGAGTATGVNPPGTPRTPAARLRRALLVAVLPVAALAGLAGWLVPEWGSASGGPGTAPPAATGPATAGSPGATPSATGPGAGTDPAGQQAGLVPAEYLGTWSGVLTSPAVALRADFRITIGQGGKDDPVGSIHNNTGAGTPYCDSSALLISVGADRLVLRTAPTSGLSGCVANPARQIYTRNSDGSLHLEVDGFTGDLAAQH
ncbi:serine/threonine-protein kinase [Kitasatospora indigofera]|uniref:serine/threonine-protein kinase n=1 Tax=Kitasatospora indigofera TaxID=67307 RepID=UPI0036C09FBE